MNPFAFFDLEPRFNIDTQELRKQFLANQRKWHPDFHATSPDMYKQAIEQTAANNRAYELLSDTYSRLKYLLLLHEVDAEKEQVLPQDFLMEMMDLSDMIEAATEGNANSREGAELQLGRYFLENETALSALAEIADISAENEGFSQEILHEAAAIYQKHRYLSRLRKNLSGIIEL